MLDNSGSVVRVIGDSGKGKLDSPVSVAIHPHTGDVYVAMKSQVNIYTPDGRYKGNITKDNITGSDQFGPVHVSFRSDGMMCISDWDTQHSLHILKDGVYIQKIGGGTTQHFNQPSGTNPN